MSAPVRNTAVVTTPAPGVSLTERRELAMFATQQAHQLIDPLLRPGDSLERVLSEVWLAMQKNPELQECTPQSLMESTARILAWGLVIGEGAFLVPFKSKVKTREGDQWETRAQAIRGYQGVVQLIVNAGAARAMQAFCVYQNEIDQGRFKITEGSQPHVHHEPILIKSMRGPLVGAYARAIISQTVPPMVLWMDVEEIDAIRMKSSKSWKTEWVGERNNRKEIPLPLSKIEWYAKKTPILQLGKYLPKTPKLEAVFAQLAREEAELDISDMVEEEPAALAAGAQREAFVEPEAGDLPPAAAAAPAPSKAVAYLMPFGTTIKGKPIGEIATKLLSDWYAWAKEQDKPSQEITDFMAAAEAVMEDRRNEPDPFG